MLYITAMADCPAFEFSWYINSPLPAALKDADFDCQMKILSIQADGDELAFIERNFKNVPICKSKRIQTWRGDMARFIIENFPWDQRVSRDAAHDAPFA